MAAPTPSSFLLPAAATGFQVPRAAFVGNPMWRLGTSWATAFAALQAVVIATARKKYLVAAVSICLCLSLFIGVSAAEKRWKRSMHCK